MIITDSAKDKIKEILDKNPGKYVRLMVQGLGWRGPRLGLALDEPEKDEKTVPVNGLDVLVSDDIQPFAEHTVVDFIKSPYGDMFDIDSGVTGC